MSFTSREGKLRRMNRKLRKNDVSNELRVILTSNLKQNSTLLCHEYYHSYLPTFYFVLCFECVYFCTAFSCFLFIVLYVYIFFRYYECISQFWLFEDDGSVSFPISKYYEEGSCVQKPYWLNVRNLSFLYVIFLTWYISCIRNQPKEI